MRRRHGNRPQALVARYDVACSFGGGALLAFVISLIHRSLAPTFNAVPRAVVLTALIIALDAAVVAPVFERSYAMFRSLVGTWLPFAAIFLGSLAAGILVTA